MISRIIFSILIFLTAILEATILPFPFVFLLSCVLFIFLESASSMTIIFLGALFLDSLAFNHIGMTAVYIGLFFLLLVVMEKLFSLSESWVLAILIIIGVEIYRRLVGYPILWGFEALLIFSLMGLIVFERRMVEKKKGKVFEG